MSSRKVLLAPGQRVGNRRVRPVQQRQFHIWEWLFGGFYNGG